MWHAPSYAGSQNQYPNGKADSLSGIVFKIEHTADAAELRTAMEELAANLPPQLQSLRRAFIVWIAHVVAPLKGIKLKSQDIEQLEDIGMLASRIHQWEDKAVAKGMMLGLEQGIEKGIEKGAWETKINTAHRMFSAGMDDQMIANLTELPLEVVQKLRSSR